MDRIKNLAIIQARTGSKRLPNKVLMQLQGKTVLEHVVKRVKQSKKIDEIVVATTISSNDLEIVKLCETKGIRVFTGSESDVLDRYYQAAKQARAENIIRITADCPLIDATVIDKVITGYESGDFDYASNTIFETYPDGEDVEIMKYRALEDAWRKAKLPSHREHVTQFILKTEKFKKHNIENDENLSDKRWTLDTESDFNFISKVFDNLYAKNECFGMELILELLREQPALAELNAGSIRNVGLQKSLENDLKGI